MADFKIKSAAGTGNKTLIQGQDQSGSNYAIQIGDAGASTLHNATITAGTISSATTLNHDAEKNAWHRSASSSVNITSAAVLDFDRSVFLGSRCTESAGTITVLDAGLYWISASISAFNYGNTDINFKLRVNGTALDGTRIYVNSVGADIEYASNTGSWAVKLSANDTVEMYGTGYYHGDGSPDTMTFFSGCRIGGLS